MYGASLKDPAHACLVMELVQGGNLHQRIYDRSAPRLTHLEILQASHHLTRLKLILHPPLTPAQVEVWGRSSVMIPCRSCIARRAEQ